MNRFAAHSNVRDALVSLALLMLGCSESPIHQGGSSGGTPISAGPGGNDTLAGAGGSSMGGARAEGGASSTGGSSSGGGSIGGAPTVEDPGPMTSDARIYTAEGNEFVIDEMGSALGEVIAGGGVDNVTLYIHGRGCGGGGEPTKSLNGAMQDLESDYSSKALMFNWPGSDVGCPLGFPEEEARASGPAFAHALHKLAYYVDTHAAALAGVKLVLISHSMGSLVLEESVADDPMPFPAALFDTLVVGSSASARADHAAWLSKVDYSPQVYVTLNDGDNVLSAAGGAPGGTRLGKNVNGTMLAANALYVDFTAASVNHAYYIHSGQNGQHMTDFYNDVMNGIPYDFAGSNAINSIEERDGTFIYTFDGQ